MRGVSPILSTSLCAAALLVTAALSRPSAQERPYPIYTADHFTQAMKTVGPAFAATNTAIGKGDYPDAKAYLAITRDRLATTITFWRDRKKDDAVKMLRDALAKLDALDAAMSPATVDAALVGTRVKEAGGACQACHATYREQDPATKAYTFKGVSK
jgi:cytochrome c556